MKHYDEHTIELFVLGNSATVQQRRELEEHCTMCFSCREIADEIREFYKQVNAKPRLLEAGQKTAYGTSPLAIRPEYSRDRAIRPSATYQGSNSAVLRFIARRPISSAAGAFVLTACILLFILNFKTIFRDPNPLYGALNDKDNRLEIYNRDGLELWHLAIDHAADTKLFLGNHRLDAYKIADLDGNSKNEVVSILQFVNGRRDDGNILTIYNSDGTIRSEMRLGFPVTYQGTLYDKFFDCQGLIIDSFGHQNNREIITGIVHHNSPYAIVRLDSKGNEIGSYWKYGHSWRIDTVMLSGQRSLLDMGRDDVNMRAVISILDPSKIVGNTECSATPGFGYPRSQAEIYYISFPFTDVDSCTSLTTPRPSGNWSVAIPPSPSR